jgi:hypothetical protein
MRSTTVTSRVVILLSLALCALLFGSVYGNAQTPAPAGNAADTQSLKDAASKGFKLNANGPVNVEAVLIPARIAARLFGKEIAHNYAAVELTVSNKNHDSAFLLHSIYIDYGDWLLSGTVRARRAAGIDDDVASNNPPDSNAVQATTEENEVASTEYRVARGEALDAQQWSSRNWTIRSLTLLGVIATGAEFAFTDLNVAKAIGAFTGQVVPAAGTFWPDGSTAQIDRISDYGFRTNKVIPKESSDIVVAFFPIDRFLTPGLKKIFLDSPAVFFLPAAALVDDAVKDKVLNVLKQVAGDQGLSAKSLRDPKLMNLLNGISMNRIRVKVGGILVIDPDTVPARIDSVTFDGTPDWTMAGTVTGTIKGTLLSNGIPEIDVLANAKADSSKSTDSDLHFTADVPAAGIKPCSTLAVDVKKTKDGKDTISNKFQYSVPATPGTPCPPN